MSNDSNVLLFISIKIEIGDGPKTIRIRPAAMEIKERWTEYGRELCFSDIKQRPGAKRIRDLLKDEGNYLYVYPDPGRSRPEITLESIFTTTGTMPDTALGNIPDEIKDYKCDLAAQCVLDEVENKGHQEAEEYLNIRIQIVSDNEIILTPYDDNS